MRGLLRVAPHFEVIFEATTVGAANLTRDNHRSAAVEAKVGRRAFFGMGSRSRR